MEPMGGIQPDSINNTNSSLQQNEELEILPKALYQNPNPLTRITGPSTYEQQLFSNLLESCPTKTVISMGAGFGLGVLFSLFMSSANHETTETFHKLSTREQLKITAKDMGRTAYSTGKNFGLVGALFASSECIIETFRGKNDLINVSSAGCVSGAILAAPTGPKGMAVGCAGFAAFSTAIEAYMRSD
ncbi:Mitochondrial import inner membrane translocase subunit tim22 [Lobulomyces angularis]|nr:Mitochondrial import inner membrane translocase subunit tim22 [Lobulomyces angularis]